VAKSATEEVPVTSISPHQLLRLTEVSKMIGLSRSSIYQMIERGRFPAGVHVGARARRWRTGEVVVWLERLGR
jgi:prophage regulatory protein